MERARQVAGFARTPCRQAETRRKKCPVWRPRQAPCPHATAVRMLHNPGRHDPSIAEAFEYSRLDSAFHHGGHRLLARVDRVSGTTIPRPASRWTDRRSIWWTTRWLGQRGVSHDTSRSEFRSPHSGSEPGGGGFTPRVDSRNHDASLDVRRNDSRAIVANQSRRSGDRSFHEPSTRHDHDSLARDQAAKLDGRNPGGSIAHRTGGNV